MCRIMEDHRDECIKRGLEQGLEQGQSNERKKVVQSLLKFMDPNTIAEKMGYPLEFVQKVAAKNKFPEGSPFFGGSFVGALA